MNFNPNEFKCGISKNEYKEQLNECEDWEVNKKKKLEEVIAGDKCPYCQEDGSCKHPSTWYSGKHFSHCPTHNDPTKGKVVVIKKEIKIFKNMFGLDTILGVAVIVRAAGHNDNNKDRHRHGELLLITYNSSSFFLSSSNCSSSVHASSSYFEKRTIWDWWANRLTSEKRRLKKRINIIN